jgi:hypothetical protein
MNNGIVEVNHFYSLKGTCRLHLQGRRIIQATKQHEAGTDYLLRSCQMLLHNMKLAAYVNLLIEELGYVEYFGAQTAWKQI